MNMLGSWKISRKLSASLSGTQLFIAALSACLIFSLIFARLNAATYGIRYVGHPDETHLYGAAHRVLHGEDLNPHFFRYPSLPIYLSAIAIKLRDSCEPSPSEPSPSEPNSATQNGAFSFAAAAKKRPVFSAPNRKGQRYEGAQLIAAARLLFAALGAALFLGVAWIARQLGARNFYFLAAIVLGLGGLLQTSIVTYQNVDTPTLFFAFAALLAVLHAFESNSTWRQAILPGLLCGFAAACKYNSGIIVLSAGLGILLSPTTTKKWPKIGYLALACLGAFLLSVPYAILDFDFFREEVLFEIRHYKNGHAGYDGPPGIPQFFYYLTELHKDYGSLIIFLAAVGIPYSFLKDWRRALIAFCFPALMLLHMSGNRVHFIRTVAPVFAIVSVYAALGVEAWAVLLQRGIEALKARFLPAFTASFIKVSRLSLTLNGLVNVAAFGLVILAAFILPPSFKRLWEQNLKPDTRDQTISWIHAELPKGSTIYLPKDLWIHRDDLSDYHIIPIATGLRDLESVLASKPSQGHPSQAILLLPNYAKPRLIPLEIRGNAKNSEEYLREAALRAKAANHLANASLKQIQANCSLHFRGRKSILGSTTRRPSDPMPSPDIRVCRL